MLDFAGQPVEFADVVRFYLGERAYILAVIVSMLTLVGALIVYWVLMSGTVPFFCLVYFILFPLLVFHPRGYTRELCRALHSRDTDCNLSCRGFIPEAPPNAFFRPKR